MKLEPQRCNCNGCIGTAAIRWKSFNEAAAAETHCSGNIATATTTCNSCNEAKAAEMHCNGCIATAGLAVANCSNELQQLNQPAAPDSPCNICTSTVATSYNSCNEAAAAAMKMQQQKHTGTVAMQLLESGGTATMKLSCRNALRRFHSNSNIELQQLQ